MQKMLFKISLNIFVIVVATTLVADAARYPPYCSHCEEEVWEEVPCDEISTSTTTTTTTTTVRPTAPTPRPTKPPRPTRPKPYPTTSTPLPTPTPRPTSTPSYSSYNTTGSNHPTPHVSTTPPSSYQKCYCECKVGCKEFCRKVVINDDLNKEITQITKTSQHGLQGQLEMKHVHQRKFVPDAYNNAPGYGAPPKSGYTYPVEGCGDGDSSCELSKPDYGLPKPPASAPVSIPEHVPLPPPPSSNIYPDPSKATTYYPEALLDSSYSIDELTKLLQSEGLGKPNLAYQPQSLYYAQLGAPNYAYGPVPPLPLGPAPGPSPAPAPAPSYSNLPAPAPSYSNLPAPAPAPNPNPDNKLYSPVRYSYAGGVLNPKPAVANAYSSVPAPSSANYPNPNYIPKENSPNAPNTYEPTTPAPAPNSDQLGAPSLNSNPAYDVALANYLKDYPYAAQSNSYSPYQAPYAISYPY